MEPPAVVYTQSMQVLDLAAAQLSGHAGRRRHRRLLRRLPDRDTGTRRRGGRKTPRGGGWSWATCAARGWPPPRSPLRSAMPRTRSRPTPSTRRRDGRRAAPDPALLLHRLHDILMVRDRSALRHRRGGGTAPGRPRRPGGAARLRRPRTGPDPADRRRGRGGQRRRDAAGVGASASSRRRSRSASARARSWWCSPTASPTPGPAPAASVSGWNVSPTRSPPAAASPVRAVVDVVTTSAMAYRRGFLGDDLAILAISPSV